MITPNSSVLIIDDFASVRVFIKNCLTSLNLTLTKEAENGVEALALLETAQKSGQQFDLIFCDWNMPKMSGIQFLRAMKEKVEYANIPVIMVTVQKDTSHVMAALCEGATDYIIKPFTQEVFLRKMISVNQKLSKQGRKSG